MTNATCSFYDALKVQLVLEGLKKQADLGQFGQVTPEFLE